MRPVQLPGCRSDQFIWRQSDGTTHWVGSRRSWHKHRCVLARNKSRQRFANVAKNQYIEIREFVQDFIALKRQTIRFGKNDLPARTLRSQVIEGT